MKYSIESDPALGCRWIHYIVATAPDGARFAHFHGEMSEEFAVPPATLRLLGRVLRARPDPRGSAFWEQMDPVAGSPADLAERAEEERLLAMEDEAFGRLDAIGGNVRWD